MREAHDPTHPAPIYEARAAAVAHWLTTHPGRHTKAEVERVCELPHGTLSHPWFWPRLEARGVTITRTRRHRWYEASWR